MNMMGFPILENIKDEILKTQVMMLFSDNICNIHLHSFSVNEHIDIDTFLKYIN